MINVYIVSGFLGAGKTTFIQKLLAEKKFEKVMLLENEFGEVGVDEAFFDKSLQVKAINNGCICCSLQGDFADALQEIESYGISDLIVEPSGVGKLSEIIQTIAQDDDYRIISHICIVDVKTCMKYHKNFKEYFDDQVISANTIILSHLDVADDEKVMTAIKMLREVNDHATISTKPINEYSINELMNLIVSGGLIDDELIKHEHHHHHHHDDDCCCHHHDHDEDDDCCCHHHDHDEDDDCCCHHHDHDEDDDCCCHHHDHDEDDDCCCHHHDHDEDDDCCCHHHDHDEDDDCCCHHHHDADGTFSNIIFRPTHIFTKEELTNILEHMDEDIIRAKGWVMSNEGTMYFNYILNEYNIFIGETKDEALVCVIGTTLDSNELKEKFHG